MASFVKKISQETFDEVVQENIKEFDMLPDDALAEAITQFQNQGIDLSILDTTGGTGRDEVIDLITIINGGPAQHSIDDVVAALQSLGSLTNPKHTMAKRNLNVLLNKGAWTAILGYLDMETTSKDVMVASLTYLIDTCKPDELCRDLLDLNCFDRLCKAVTSSLDTLTSTDTNTNTLDVLLLSLRLAKISTKSENNKVMLMQKGIGSILASVFRTTPSPLIIPEDKWSEVLTEGCLLIKGLCTFDDLRREMSCAYENSRHFVGASGITSSLMRFALDFLKQPTLAAAAMSATRQLVLSEDAVLVVAEHGGMELPKAVLSTPSAAIPLVRSVVGLMRNLCADDQRKNRLVNDGTMSLLLQALTSEEYLPDFSFAEHALATLAAMSLRSPLNAARILEVGGIDAMLKAMRRHPTREALQRQGCLAVRNIACRSVESRTIMLDAGVEGVLRDAGKLRGAVDHAYAALRDLGCPVNYVKIAEDGAIQPVYESFGAKKNLNFNPSAESSTDIQERVASEARAPFSSGCETKHCFDGHDHTHTHEH